MSRKQLRIGLDMDGVLVDVEPHFLKYYGDIYQTRLLSKDIIGKTEEQAFPTPRAIKTIASIPGFFRTAPVMDGAPQVVRELTLKYEVFVVSAATEFPQSLEEKYYWLEEHFPFIKWTHIVFCGNKNFLNMDFLIDDHERHFKEFSGTGLLFDAFHNQTCDNYLRLKNWKDVQLYFEHR